MVEIKEAVKKLSADLDNTADAMLVVIYKDGNARSGVFGLDATYSDEGAQALALTMKHMLDTSLSVAYRKAERSMKKGEASFFPGKEVSGRGLDDMEELMEKAKLSAEDKRAADYEAIVRHLLAKLLGRDEA